MKRLLCLLTLSLCSLSWMGVRAQTQEVFPTKNARWEVLVPAPLYEPPLKGTERAMDYLTYTVGTDSIIGTNGLKYYDLFVDSLYAGSIRTEKEKVWITFDKGDHETLLYDFGVKVGDIIRQENTEYFFETPFYETYSYNSGLIWFHWEYPTDLEVINVRDGVYGKEIEVLDSSTRPDIWCKGIGSLYGMFLGRRTTTNGGHANGGCLWMQEVNGVRNYPEQDYGDIKSQVGLSEIYEDQNFLSYDPDSKMLQLTKQEMTGNCLLEVYSVDGTCILHKDLSVEESSISLSFFSSGVYICKLCKDNQIIATQKIRL